MAVYVLGSINVDHVSYVENLPLKGETVFGDYAQFPGGKGCNQAIAAARSGVKVVMYGAVGDDAAAQYMRQFLTQEKIDIDTIITVTDKSTGVALIAVDADSENTISVCPGANYAVTFPSELAPELTPLDVCLSQGETPQSVVDYFFKYAKSMDAMTVFNPAPYADIPEKMLENIDILVVNEIEFSQYLGLSNIENDPQEVARLLKNNSHEKIVVTMGGLGVIAKIGGDIIRLEAPVVTAIDTVGAGDCFCGNLAARLALGDTEKEALIYAVKAASFSVTRKGAASSMPFANEI